MFLPSHLCGFYYSMLDNEAHFPAKNQPVAENQTVIGYINMHYINCQLVPILLDSAVFFYKVLKEIKICIMAVFYPVRTGQSDHRSRKFSVLTVFVGEFCCVEEASDLLIAHIIIAPFKP